MPPVRELAPASHFATVDDSRVEQTGAYTFLDIIITICAMHEMKRAGGACIAPPARC